MVSNIHSARLALVPGVVESFEKEAVATGNMAWSGMTKGIKYARNALYVCAAVVVIAAVGAALAATGTVLQYVFIAVVILGSVHTGLAAKRLYDAASLLHSSINAGFRP
jgi:hypothetical protein